MGKRRTRKDKETARHAFNISWSPEPSVKGQFNSEAKKVDHKADELKSARIMAKDASFVSSKRDIVKSLLIASLILALEVVLYLAWNK